MGGTDAGEELPPPAGGDDAGLCGGAAHAPARRVSWMGSRRLGGPRGPGGSGAGGGAGAEAHTLPCPGLAAAHSQTNSSLFSCIFDKSSLSFYRL